MEHKVTGCIIALMLLFSCNTKQECFKFKKGDSILIKFYVVPRIYIVTYNDTSRRVVFYKEANQFDYKDTITGFISYSDISTYSNR